MIYLIADNSARLNGPIEIRDRQFSNSCRHCAPKCAENAVNLVSTKQC
jgi:hypothetical protein